MKKLVYILIIFFSLTNLVNANWYGKHAVSAPNPWWTTLSSVNWGWPNKWTWCDSDGDTTWWSPSFPYSGTRDYAVALNNNSSSTDYRVHSDSEINISWTTIYCLYWDWYTPTWTGSYYNWWTNQAHQTVSYSVNDAGWSKLSSVVLQWRTSTNSPSFTSWSSRTTKKTNTGINSNSFSTSFSYNWNNHTAYQFRLIIRDNARNQRIVYWSSTTKFDFTNPNTSNITSNPIAWTNILATTSYNFAVTAWSDIWSPIVMVQWFFEDYNSCSNWWLSRSSTNSATLSINPNISKANTSCDWNNSIGWRNYTFKITYVKDQAWNSIWAYNASNSYWWVKSFTYNVYSNHIDSFNTSWTHKVITNELGDNKTADWNNINLEIELKDRYWNEIINSSWINRTIKFNFNYKNTLYADQYRSRWNALYMKTPSSSDSINNTKLIISSSNQTYNWMNTQSTDWKYNFIFKAYTPTYKNWATDWRQFANKNSDFIINLIDVNINSNLWNISNIGINNSNIDSEFKPLYYTNITWEQRNYWFIEWTVQNWTIEIHKNWTKSTSSNDLYLEFWKADRTASTKVKMYTISPTQEVIQWYQTNMTNLNPHTNNFSNNPELHTKIKQIPWQTLANLQNYYLSTHIRYKIDGKFVDYNSDILNKNNYFDNSTITNNTTQNWLKVLWITYSKTQKNIINNQDIKDIHVLGNLTKSKLKSQIRKNIYKAILNISDNNAQWWSNNDINDLSWNDWNSNNKWKIIFNKKVLYFDLSNSSEKTITMWTWTLTWRKTIIIKWWDLYIKWNIYLNSKSDILWIAVLKDKNWKWWNIYISPNVTYIAAQIYTDWAIFSAWWPTAANDWEDISSHILWIDTNQSVLANQLFIKWQIFSENTIWGSRKNPAICPYYDKVSCTLEKAQKYDLNYLRRYFTYDSNNNWTIDSIANWWKYYYNWNIKSSYDWSYKYINYPIVIEYNPMIQITPPPLFTK